MSKDSDEKPELRTAEDWQGEVCPPAWLHAAAATLHHWPLHAHHAGKPIELTLADYRAALEAAERSGVPHKPALSPHVGKSIRG